MSSGPSGPSIPRSQRKRPGTELTVCAHGLAALDALWAQHPTLTRPSVAERAWIYCMEHGVDLCAIEIDAPAGTVLRPLSGSVRAALRERGWTPARLRAQAEEDANGLAAELARLLPGVGPAVAAQIVAEARAEKSTEP